MNQGPQTTLIYKRTKSHTHRSDGPIRVGEITRQLLQKKIKPRQKKNSFACQAWQQLIPQELACHCKVESLTTGQLEVVADSPVYIYELQLCSSQLIQQINQYYPSIGIKSIKIKLGQV